MENWKFYFCLEKSLPFELSWTVPWREQTGVFLGFVLIFFLMWEYIFKEKNTINFSSGVQVKFASLYLPLSLCDF